MSATIEKPARGKSKSAQMRKYGFFPGCVAKESCKELFNSTMLLADKLGIETRRVDGGVVLRRVRTQRHESRCCACPQRAHVRPSGGAGPRRCYHDLLDMYGPHACREQRAALESEAHMGQANAILGKFGAKYEGTVMVRHLLWLLIGRHRPRQFARDGGQSAPRSQGRGVLWMPHHPPRIGQRVRNRRAIRIRSRTSLKRLAVKPSTMPERRAAAGSTSNSRRTGSQRTWSGRTCAWQRTKELRRFSRHVRSVISPSTVTRQIRRHAGDGPTSRPSTFRNLLVWRLELMPRCSVSTSTSFPRVWCCRRTTWPPRTSHSLRERFRGSEVRRVQNAYPSWATDSS